MMKMASFDVGQSDVHVSSKLSKVMISLQLSPHIGDNRAFPISGFPRALMSEESVKGE